MSATTTATTPIERPADFVRETDKISAETGFPRVQLLRSAVRRFSLSERR